MHEAPNFETEPVYGVSPIFDIGQLRQTSVRSIAIREERFARIASIIDGVFSSLDEKTYPMSDALIVEMIDRLNLYFQQKKWNTYDDVEFDSIRQDLEKKGLPVKPKKTGSSYHDVSFE